VGHHGPPIYRRVFNTRSDLLTLAYAGGFAKAAAEGFQHERPPYLRSPFGLRPCREPTGYGTSVGLLSPYNRGTLGLREYGTRERRGKIKPAYL
jgi:hypothetical protein